MKFCFNKQMLATRSLILFDWYVNKLFNYSSLMNLLFSQIFVFDLNNTNFAKIQNCGAGAEKIMQFWLRLHYKGRWIKSKL